ncbi:MAG: ABC transporter permease [Defluviitaleaceae bacterium]|nr:ABC transporter permease [Defluviitaleaceae bacterium]
MKRYLSQISIIAKRNFSYFNWSEFFIYKILLSILTLTFYVLVANFTTGEINLERWVVGNAFFMCVMECIHYAGVIFNAERFNGTLRSIVVSPSSNLFYIATISSWNVFIAFVTVLFSFLAGGLIFNINFTDINFLVVITGIFAAIISTASLGILLSVFSLVTDSMYLVLNTVASLIMIFSSANFPIEQLPRYVRWISYILPLSNSIRATNIYMYDTTSINFFRFLGYELCLAIFYVVIALSTIKIIEKISIQKATLEIF